MSDTFAERRKQVLSRLGHDLGDEVMQRGDDSIQHLVNALIAAQHFLDHARNLVALFDFRAQTNSRKGALRLTHVRLREIESTLAKITAQAQEAHDTMRAQFGHLGSVRWP